MMQILYVEDDLNFAKELIQAVERTPGVAVTHVTSRDSARTQLSARVFDLLILDLNIPASDTSLDPDKAHGKAIAGAWKQLFPGTPLVVVSAYASLEDDIPTLFDSARQEDLFGSGTPVTMVNCVTKSNLDPVLKVVGEHAVQIAALEGIAVEMDPGDDPLGREQRRLLRIFARPRDGAVLRVQRLSGGLSGVTVCRVGVEDRYGRQRARVVARFAPLYEIEEESRAYDRLISPMLKGNYAVGIDTILVGGGSHGATFYRYADGFDQSLFAGLSRDPSTCSPYIDAVRDALRPWFAAATVRTITVGELRRSLVDDAQLGTYFAKWPGLGFDALESREVQVRWCTRHGDLHGGNVLMMAGGKVQLIDYGRVGDGPSALDPLTLELGLLFHPAGRAVAGGWPTVSQAQDWADLDKFVEGTAWGPFVRSVRAWAHEDAFYKREVFATCYAYAVRQLRFTGPSGELPLAVASAAASALLATYT